MGTFPGATGKNFQSIAKRSLENLAAGTCKMDVVDPVLGNGCVTPTMDNINWIPTKTATSGAFTSALVRWIIENRAFNEEFLSFPNYKAAFDGGYASFSNAAHLVIVDESHKNHRKLLRAADAGIAEPEQKAGAAAQQHFVVVDAATGRPALAAQCAKGQLEFEGEVNGVKVRTAFLLLKDAVDQHTLDEYAEITGIPRTEIERIAREFTSHGVKASVQCMGGTATVNGVDTAFGFRTLHALIGCNQMAGGNTPTRAGVKTTANGARYALADVEGSPKVSTKNAAYIARTAKAWTKTKEYELRVAAGEADPQPKLPWFPVTLGSDNQALVSIVNQYPYQCKIMVSWMNSILEGTPGAMRDSIIERLKDPSVLPLHIACDIVIGEQAQLADYIVPDTNFYESFGVMTQEGNWHGKGNAVRWQAKPPETAKLSDGRFASYEAFLVDVAKACGVPGFGANAIKDVDGNSWPLEDASDFFLKAVANLAYADEPVSDILPAEARMQALDELPDSWKSAVTEDEWPKVLNVLSRGGRFWPIDGRTDERGRSSFAKEFQTLVYSEMRATNPNDYSKEHAPGTLSWIPQTFADGTPMTERFSAEEYPFVATNYKARFRSVTMLANSPIMRDLAAHNYLEINEADAAKLGIADGDRVRALTPAGDAMEGVAWVRAGIAPSTFAVSFGYGHRAYGAQDAVVDGKLAAGDPAIGAGIHLETMLDPVVSQGDVLFALSDSNGSTPGRNGGMYKIEKA